MKRALLILVVALIAVGGTVYYLSRLRLAPVPSPEASTSSSVFSLTAPGSAPAAREAAVSSATGTASATAAPALPEASPKFTSFLASEALQMNSTHVDVSAAEARLKQEAAAMGAPEIAYARALALNSEGNGNQRVLAVALLTKADFNLALPALTEIITKGMNSARAEAHSTDEIKNTQAKAFAVMAVDALAERAAKDARARDELIRMGSLAQDSTIQKYIQERIRSLPPL